MGHGGLDRVKILAIEFHMLKQVRAIHPRVKVGIPAESGNHFGKPSESFRINERAAVVHCRSFVFSYGGMQASTSLPAKAVDFA
jgi:hypothetical protein